MENSRYGFLLAIISMAGLGFSNFLYKQSTDSIGPVNTTFFYYLFSVSIATVVWFFFKEDGKIELINLLWPALIAIFLFSSVLSFTFAVKYINVSVGSTIRSLSFIVTIVLAVLFYKEELYLKDYIALFFAVSAVILFGIEQK